MAAFVAKFGSQRILVRFEGCLRPQTSSQFDPSRALQEHVGYGFVVVIAAAVGQLSSPMWSRHWARAIFPVRS